MTMPYLGYADTMFRLHRPTDVNYGDYRDGEIVINEDNIYVWSTASHAFVKLCDFGPEPVDIDLDEVLIRMLGTQDEELSADDTKELDEFLASFVRGNDVS